MQESKGMQELMTHFHEGRFSHAFLLETNNQENCFQSLLELLSYINQGDDEEENLKLSRLIKSENLPSLVVIRPDGQTIKKEQIIELKHIFQTKPTFSKYNMYVILNAESLNSSSANTMLKFLEEPEDNIIGFFITNNKENIIDTIRSRCQIVLDYYSNGSLVAIPKVWESIAINYMKEIHLVHDEALLYNKNVILPLVHDKKELFYLFQSILQIYEVLFQVRCKSSNLPEEFVSLNFLLKYESSYFLRELHYLSQILNEMNYNINIQLFLDRYVLESR